MVRVQFRQGDVVLEQEDWIYDIRTIPTEAVKTGAQSRVEIARGEKTGHSHVLECPQEIEMFERDGTLYLRVPQEATLTHQEHAEIKVPAGDYKVVQQQEYDPAVGQRPVLD